MGSKLLLESDFFGFFERVAKYLGVTGEKNLDRIQINTLERVWRNNSPKLVQDIEKIGEKFESGAEREAEQLLDKLLSDKNVRESFMVVFKMADKKTYLQIIDAELKRRFGKENYEYLSKIYYDLPENQRVWGMQQMLKKLGLNINEYNERLFKDWVPTKFEETHVLPPRRTKPEPVEKQPEAHINTNGGLSPSEIIENPKLMIDGSGVDGVQGNNNIFNKNIDPNMKQKIIDGHSSRDARAYFRGRTGGVKIVNEKDFGTQEIIMAVAETNSGKLLFDFTGRDTLISLTIVLKPEEKISQLTIDKIYDKFKTEINNMTKDIPMVKGGLDVTKIPKDRWSPLMNKMENFVSGK